ncbi:Thioredoxin-like protein 1 [Ceratocystis pirilliformis]|uniref:Thioredoxin-like protein 1 n=1 Tax=Ceratocystis pirilliformis TaxID=259994 RepID=A0ABR3YWW7_9PEZI
MALRNISTTAEFQALLKSHQYVVADFWASWCGPCKAIAPLFQTLSSASAVPDKLAFAKIDIDELNELAQEYGVSSIPTFVVFEGGKVMDQMKGAVPAKLNELVKTANAKATATPTFAADSATSAPASAPTSEDPTKSAAKGPADL